MNARTFELLPVKSIRIRAQVRTTSGLDHESLAGLAESIRTLGMLEPIIVAPDDEATSIPAGGAYVLIAGERRLLAADLAGLTAVPAIIQRTDTKHQAAAQLAENVQRHDLSPLETAEGLHALKTMYGTWQAVCNALGKTASWVSTRASLIRLPDELKTAARAGLTRDPELLNALAALRVEDETGDQYAAAVEGLETGTTTRQSVKAARAYLAAVKAEAEKANDPGCVTEDEPPTTAPSPAPKAPPVLTVPLVLTAQEAHYIAEALRDKETDVARAIVAQIGRALGAQYVS